MILLVFAVNRAQNNGKIINITVDTKPLDPYTPPIFVEYKTPKGDTIVENLRPYVLFSTNTQDTLNKLKVFKIVTKLTGLTPPFSIVNGHDRIPDAKILDFVMVQNSAVDLLYNDHIRDIMTSHRTVVVQKTLIGYNIHILKNEWKNTTFGKTYKPEIVKIGLGKKKS